MTYFAWKCPACSTEMNLHEPGCKHEFVEIQEFEMCYIDIISTVLDYMSVMNKYDRNPAMDPDLLQDRVEEIPDLHSELDPQDQELLDLESVSTDAASAEVGDPTRDWTELHDDCLRRLKQERRIIETPDGLVLTKPEERVEQVIPTFEPLKTIYEHGPVDGVQDYSVYTMVSWCSLKELTWEQTQNFIREWLTETNGWERESWGEASIDELLNDKYHVWNSDLGWGEMADIARNEIERSDVEPQIDASSMVGLEASDYD